MTNNDIGIQTNITANEEKRETVKNFKYQLQQMSSLT
jgi:hypothetical protein